MINDAAEDQRQFCPSKGPLTRTEILVRGAHELKILVEDGACE